MTADRTSKSKQDLPPLELELAQLPQIDIPLSLRLTLFKRQLGAQQLERSIERLPEFFLADLAPYVDKCIRREAFQPNPIYTTQWEKELTLALMRLVLECGTDQLEFMKARKITDNHPLRHLRLAGLIEVYPETQKLSQRWIKISALGMSIVQNILDLVQA